jgi:hypothetical protein
MQSVRSPEPALQSFGLKLADPKFLSIPFVKTKCTGPGKFSVEDKCLSFQIKEVSSPNLVEGQCILSFTKCTSGASPGCQQLPTHTKANGSANKSTDLDYKWVFES